MIPNKYTYIDLLTACDYLKLDTKKVGAEGGQKANTTVQGIKFTSKHNGTDGNTIGVQYVAGAPEAGKESVTLNGMILTIAIASGQSKLSDVIATLSYDDNFKWLLTAEMLGTATDTVTAMASAQMLTAGAWDASFDARLNRTLVRMINAACSKIEGIIDGPVMTRELYEEQDGSNQNAIKPHHWPVRAITELRVDYNRQWADETIVRPHLYFIRGHADYRRTKGTDVALQMQGDDVILRDDNETVIIGRLFTGSIMGSIRMKYRAGWGETLDELPADLQLASQQLLEFFFYQRENRDIGVASKGVKGESYTKMKDGIPEQIFQMVQQYQDTSFGTSPSPGRNFYSI